MKTLAEIIVGAYDDLNEVNGVNVRMVQNGDTVSFVFDRDVQQEVDDEFMKTVTQIVSVPI